MKKLALLLSILALGITSCSKDDNGGGQTSFEGTWEYSKDGEIVDGLEILSNWDHTPGCPKDYSVITTTTVTDHIFYKENNTCDEETYSSNYSRNGNTLSITLGTITRSATILQLDANTLKVATEAEQINGQTVRNLTVYTRK